MKTAVVVFSGGPDSATLLYLVMKRNYKPYPITFNYGQLAGREIEAAKRISSMLGLELKTVDLSSLKEVFLGKTALVDDRIPMTGDFSKELVVPFRNGIMLSIAIAYAHSLGARHVFYGAQASDVNFYPDCRPKFISAFQRAARFGMDEKIIVKAPLIKMKKSDVLRLGKELGVPFELTWSCYRNGERHCGRCESCVNRKKAFAEAGIEDPTEYEE